MPRQSYQCEPFRAWNRLENRPRKYDFDEVLKSEVHDPLWNLTRQWQFGEFKGEDTGSAIFAKVLQESTKLVKYKLYKGVVHGYSDESPLEAVVERQSRILGYNDRIQAGNHCLKLLEHFGNLFNQNGLPTQPAYDKTAYRDKLQGLFPLVVPEIDDRTPELLVQSAQLYSNRRLMNFVRTFAGRIPDGLLMYNSILDDEAGFIEAIKIEATHQDFIQDTVAEFKKWFASAFPEALESETSWNAAQLEYQFKCALPEKSGNNTVLAANEYYTGRLDWHSFDVETLAVSNTDALSTSDELHKKLIETEVISFIPSPAGFGGMPVNRFWEFEDGKVDLGKISADTTDISKIIVVEYATMYGNNWFLIPYPLKAGSLATVKGIVVTDVFGQKTFVEPAIQGEADDWYGWGMFNLTAWDKKKSFTVPADTRIFIPPVVPKIQESAPIEEVLFVRDEMANMVWAIENKVDSLLQSGMDGHKAAIELAPYFEQVNNIDPTEVDPEAILRYILSNTVPENWIPFISIHIEGQNRAVQLQRASMPRMIGETKIPVRPRTSVLRSGFSYNPAAEVKPYINPSANLQSAPYFINEEEIPKAGIKVMGNYQRTRWYNGDIVLWYGYKKTLGKGEGSSGLKFDMVEFIKKKK